MSGLSYENSKEFFVDPWIIFLLEFVLLQYVMNTFQSNLKWSWRIFRLRFY
jgi:hypothetical protein